MHRPDGFAADAWKVRQAPSNKKRHSAIKLSACFLLWSGKRGSNPRPSAWEADTLPLSYSRIGSGL